MTAERRLTTYFDSSALVAVYVPEAFSEAARRAVASAGPVPFTGLHRMEVLNAFELLVGRGLIARFECRAIQAQLQDDVAGQRLVELDLDLDSVFADAVTLSQRYAAKFLARGLGLLHVAAAASIPCTSFVSADDRQLAVARAMGLRTVEIKRRARRQRR